MVGGLVWGIGLRRLGCVCGRRLGTGSCVSVRQTTNLVVRGLGRAFLCHVCLSLNTYQDGALLDAPSMDVSAMEAAVASGAPVLSSEDALDVERSLAPPITDLTLAEFDITATAKHICRGFRRVGLQFPDELLPHAEAVFEALQSAVAQHWSSAEPVAELFVLADTTFDGFQVDFVSAQYAAQGSNPGRADFARV